MNLFLRKLVQWTSKLCPCHILTFCWGVQVHFKIGAIISACFPPTGLQLPEGVDPSFLAALPENIRQEVLQDHLGIRHAPHPSGPVPSSAPSSSQGEQPASGSLSQVNPEFLAALPPHIQEEVSARPCLKNSYLKS